MGVNYKKFETKNEWINSFDDILSELINEGEIEIDDETSLQDFVCDDGFFRVKGKIVLAYIRDQQLSRREKNKLNGTTYKYHLLNCKHLREFHKKNYIEKYVLRNPSYLGNEGDAKFNINVIEGGNLIQKGLNEQMLVCKYCLSESNFKGYTNIKQKTLRNKFVDSFNYKEFFDSDKIKIKDLWSLNIRDEDKVNINAYPPNWRSISARVREKNQYCCYGCKVDLNKNKSLLHVHHLNGRKDDNSISNLITLCVVCHSRQNGHSFMREFYKKEIFECENIRFRQNK